MPGLGLDWGAALTNIGNTLQSSGITQVATTAIQAAVAKKLAPKIVKPKTVVKTVEVPGAAPRPSTPVRSGMPSWVLPVGIAVGVLVVGGVLVVAMKKKGS